jgi:magnesium transporter
MPKSKRHRGRLKIARRVQPGVAPGTLVADPKAPQPEVQVIAFGPDGLIDETVAKAADVRQYLGRYPVIWVDVDGLGDIKAIEEIGRVFGLHHLALEDVVNVHQRSKVEEYDDHIFWVARMVSLNDHVETEQISLFLGKNFVLTFQERPGGDCLNSVRQRLHAERSALRQHGADYLAYEIFDAIVDGYFPVLERLSDQLEELDDQLFDTPSPDMVARIHHLRRELLILRRAVSPHRDAVNELLHLDSPLIGKETRFFLRDVYDHTAQLMDLVASYREVCTELKDTYLSLVSNRLNEVIKVLTIISTIFMPLGFIAGVYGMNFEVLPGKSDWWGFFASLAFMASVAGGLMYWFWRKGWLRS